MVNVALKGVNWPLQTPKLKRKCCKMPQTLRNIDWLIQFIKKLKSTCIICVFPFITFVNKLRLDIRAYLMDSIWQTNSLKHDFPKFHENCNLFTNSQAKKMRQKFKKLQSEYSSHQARSIPCMLHVRRSSLYDGGSYMFCVRARKWNTVFCYDFLKIEKVVTAHRSGLVTERVGNDTSNFEAIDILMWSTLLSSLARTHVMRIL